MITSAPNCSKLLTIPIGLRTVLLLLFNRWWVEEQIPEEHLLAQVVTILKKGDTQKIWNYRPISLLNIAYKLYASIV